MSTQIKKQRIRTGLTQEEAAIKLAIHPTTLNKYEGGSRTPSGKVLSAMSQLFGVPMDNLMDNIMDNIVQSSDAFNAGKGEDSMYRLKFEQLQGECIDLHKEISSLKDELLKNQSPSKRKKA